MRSLQPKNLEELAQAVAKSAQLRVCGTGTKRALLKASDGEVDRLDLAGLSGVLEFEPHDQVVSVWAGTPVSGLQEELKPYGLRLPLPDASEFGGLLAGVPGTVGGLISMDLPHGLFAQHGGPKDWTLAVTVVRPDGTVARCGAKTVKNVAGYDVQKLFVGARGTLGVLAQATLRLVPLRAMRRCEGVRFCDWDGGPLVVHRVLPSDFEAARAAYGGSLLAQDGPSATLWAARESPPERFRADWAIGSCPAGARWWRPDPAAKARMARAKAVFDPQGKLNPGEEPA